MSLDVEAIRKYLESVVVQYEKSAPAVSQWADNLYIRLHEDVYNVRIAEILQAQMLHADDCWEHANFAQNRIYKLMDTLGQDTTGMNDF